MSFATEQEGVWAGEFGDAYTKRNEGDDLLASNVALFARALQRAGKPASCIEFGANIGLNLRALAILSPNQEQHAVEISAKAVVALRRAIPAEHVTHGSILEFAPTRTWDLALAKGILIHLNPEALSTVYDRLVDACAKWFRV
jgi:pseudaminic acid biosynthesis-associated methylase